ncbi:hypothetical protein NNRS527_03230 (plasmid) [Nitrosospira sp. NRS527]|nr:hypothetical protein NNRS527_03230 [Nitrosospira sp. NRS527]
MGAVNTWPIVPVPNFIAVPPNGPSSRRLVAFALIKHLTSRATYAPSIGKAGLSFRTTNVALSLGVPVLRPTIKHSPMPVSAEKDMSPLSSPVMDTIISSEYCLARSARELAHASPDIKLSGITSASMPSDFSLRSANTRKIEASPALP